MSPMAVIIMSVLYCGPATFEMCMLAYNTKSRAGLLKNVSAKPNEKSAPLAAAASS